MAARRRRSRNGYLENLGGLPRSTMLTFGLALLLLLASVGIVGTTLVRRGPAEQSVTEMTPEPTQFVAIVETPPPSAQPTPTRPAVTRVAPAAPSATTRVSPTAVAAPLGAGPGRAARGIAGSMAVSLGGTLPPPEVAVVPTPTRASVAANQPATPTPTPSRAPSSGGAGAVTPPPNRAAPGGGAVAPTPTPYRPPAGSGSSNTPPTPTPYRPPAGSGSSNTPPTPTPTRVAPTSTPTQVPPTPTPGLPAATLPGPGSKTYSYDLTFTQGTALVPPTGAQAWVTTWRTFTIVDANTLKAALGMTGAVEQVGGGFRVTTPGTLLINNTLGTISYTAPAATSASVGALSLPTRTGLTPGPANPVTATPAPATTPVASPTPASTTTPGPSPRPSGTVTRPGGSPTPAPSQLTDPAAIAAAREWLTDVGIMPANADAGRVTRPTTGQVWVTFHPQPLGNLIPQDPMIQVKLGLDGAVREVYHRWPTNLVPREVTVRELSVAWSEVAAGGGYLEVDQTVPQDLPANTVFTGNAVVARVAIGWAPGTDGKTNYLLPLYVFEGTVTLANPPKGQPASVPFRVYIAATAP